jgi:hypothetical protein
MPTAGGCLMFRSVRHTKNGDRSLIGVVLGQRGGNLITAGLSAAKQLADRVAPPAGAYIAGISKTPYAPATPRRLD